MSADCEISVAIPGQDPKWPPFRPGTPRYDQTTFYGRLRHFIDVTDPTTLFTSQAKLDKSLKLIDDFKQGTLDSSVTNEELWRAQKIKTAMIHPDTGKKIFIAFRMSGYAWFGSPIATAILVPGLTLPQTVFWQWMNQTKNACVNFANRNASKPTPMKRFLLGYTGAITTSCSIAVGLTVLIRRANSWSYAKKMLVQKFVPFPAVTCASVCNVLLMRNNELFEGVAVFKKNGEVIGVSKKAARQGLEKTAISRAVLAAPVLLVPPIGMALLEKTSLLKRRPRFHLAFNAFFVTFAFAAALPVSLALFPQISKIHRSSLEQEIQQSAGDEEVLYFNKGL
ncbi:sideroflexin-5-like [Lineus longissimus]|uniref:sideroflexin-5-like n=1 Tax=Lineus longissimus TaxID=88925 RepID=UPI002B4F26A3